MLNLLIIGLFLVFPIVSAVNRGSSPSTIAFMASIAVAVLFVPRLFQTLLLKNASTVLRVLGFGQWAVIGFIALRAAGFIPSSTTITGLVYLVFVLGVAVNFWIMSDWRIVTARNTHARFAH